MVLVCGKEGDSDSGVVELLGVAVSGGIAAPARFFFLLMLDLCGWRLLLWLLLVVGTCAYACLLGGGHCMYVWRWGPEVAGGAGGSERDLCIVCSV